MMAESMNGAALLHIRFEGRSVDIPLGDLDVGALSAGNVLSVKAWVNSTERSGV